MKSSFSRSIFGLLLLVGEGCGSGSADSDANAAEDGDGESDGGGDEVGDGDGDGDAGDGDGDGDGGDGEGGDGDGDGGDGDGEGGDGDGEGDGDGDGEADGDAGGDGDGEGKGEEGGDGDGDGGEGDGDGGESGGSELTIEQACADTCALFNLCVGEIPGCVDACTGYHEGLNASCLAAELAFDECVLALDCQQLSHFVGKKPKPYPCQAEQEASCQNEDECTVIGGVGQAPGECSLAVDCPNEPERSLACDGTHCTCYVDGVEVGGCDDPLPVCEDPGPVSLAACCA